jgi:cation diffusion facilitator family transporter
MESQPVETPADWGRRLAAISVGIGVLLSVVKVSVGLAAHSTSLISDGLEGVADVLSSAIVFLGLTMASRPPDENHPYGHGRYETLSGLAVGGLLLITGVAIFWRSLETLNTTHQLHAFALYPLIGSVVIKTVLSLYKRRVGRRIGSSALEADAWHDMTDLVSTTVAMVAIALTLIDSARFRYVDHVGGMVIGAIIVWLAIRVVRQTVDYLTDTMPSDDMMHQVREVALQVPGAKDIEKCFARRTGLRYHVDLHLEVDPEMTVRESHAIATQVRICIKEELSWVADVLVHVEPSGGLQERSAKISNYPVGWTGR